MSRHFRPILPPPIMVAIFAALYLFSYFMDIFLVCFGYAVPMEVRSIRWILVVFASGFYGFYRVWGFHPSFSSRYFQWLCLSPWSVDKPLAQGPVNLIWADLIPVGALTLLAYTNIPSSVAVPAVVFLGVYLIALYSTLESEQIGFLVAFAFLAPFAVYPFRNQYVAVLALLALYTLGYYGLRRSLRGFPWNTKYWRGDQVKQLRTQAIRTGVIGWPFKYLNVYKSPGISFKAGLVLSVLLTWWLHAIFRIIGEPYRVVMLILLFQFVFIVAVTRAVIYTRLYRPPISLLGRIFTFRWIIPKYDKVYVAPVGILLIGWLTPLTLHLGGISRLWTVELSFFLTLLYAFSMPPTLKDWRLTGAYRFGKLAQSRERRRPAGASDPMLAEWFSSKFDAHQ